MKHEGLSKNRLNSAAGNDREASFAKAWQHINRDEIGVNDIITHIIPNYTDRDAAVAATIIQWLGSNVGMAFLHGVMYDNDNVRLYLNS